MSEETEKRGAGRPTKYTDDMCDAVIELGMQGKSYVQIAVRLGVSRETLYDWARDNEKFSDTLKRARECAQSWWEDKGQEGLDADKFNAGVWNKSMSCRFPDDYSDKKKIELSGSKGFVIEFTDEPAADDSSSD